MSKFPSLIGKIIYGGIFVVALPLLLFVWARSTEAIVPLPTVESLIAGIMIAVVGAVLTIGGMVAIYVYGHGLPMNAYPPSRFVTESFYRLLPHPIYTGFSILCFGTAIAAGSRSGFWLVSPAVVLSCLALVYGYENDATKDLFGEQKAAHIVRLPPPGKSTPAVEDRFSALLIGVGTPLLFLYLPTLISPLRSGSVSVLYRSDLGTIIAEALYLGSYLLIITAPFASHSSDNLRNFVKDSHWVTGIAILLFVAYPHQISQFSLATVGIAYWLGSGTTFIAAAVQIALIMVAARTAAGKNKYRRYFVAGLASVSVICGLWIGAQVGLSVILGVAIFLVSINVRRVWAAMKALVEHIANSWTEWRFGPVRIINHGIYAAVGAFVALTIAGTLVGPALVPYIILITLLGIVVSSLSAQWIEGSPMLLRPYGWYGGVAGTLLGILIAYALGGDVWLLAAAFCVGAPWIQAAGRLRCLVQGCCHGRKTSPGIGIRYSHPMSRVCRLSDLKNIPVYPTQLYSILSNVVIALFTTRLWLSGANFTLIIGTYFILSGLSRFVEESYRGEPQTPKVGGLRLYQIFAILSVVGGIAVTMCGNPQTAGEIQFNLRAIIASSIFGLFVLFAFGIDLPNSNKRFTRLA